MAIAMKCDRCLKYYEKYGVPKEEANSIAFTYFDNECHAGPLNISFKDLCPECLSKLDRFIRLGYELVEKDEEDFEDVGSTKM